MRERERERERDGSSETEVVRRILANPLPGFSLPAILIFLNFARFSLFFTYHNAQQHTAILRRCLGVKDSKNKKWRSLGAALHQQNKPKFRYYNRKFKSMCAPFLSYKELSSPRQVLQGASLKTIQTKNQKEKQALASSRRQLALQAFLQY